jgi:hypothetical protein
MTDEIVMVCAADVKMRRKLNYLLRRLLREGPRCQKEIAAAALEYGYTVKQLRAAREKLGIAVQKTGFGAAGAWMWHLPAS